MTPAVIISLAGVLCAIGVAVLGVVWRLGTRTGELKVKIEAFDEALQRADETGRKWNDDVIAAVRELDTRLSNQQTQIGDLQNQWRTAHRIVQKVADLDNRLSGIEAVCHDRIRCEISRPIMIEDGVPELFDAERTKK